MIQVKLEYHSLIIQSQFELKLRNAREKIRYEKGRFKGPKTFGTLGGESEVLKIIRRLRRKPRNGGRKRMTYQSIAENQCFRKR